MKLPKIANAMNYLDDDLISDAEKYKPQQRERHFFQWTKWRTIAACFLILALISGIIPFVNAPQTFPFVITAYAMENETVGNTMKQGKGVPVTMFQTTTGITGFVFSCDNPDPNVTPSTSIISSGTNYSDKIGEITGISTDPTQNYYIFIPPENHAAPYSFPIFVSDVENEIVYQYNLEIKESDNGYIAELVEVSKMERKIK